MRNDLFVLNGCSFATPIICRKVLTCQEGVRHRGARHLFAARMNGAVGTVFSPNTMQKGDAHP
jgi:hypothetical protein